MVNEEAEHEELPEDSRTQIIANELWKLHEMEDMVKDVPEAYKLSFERMSLISDSMVWLLVALLFITKPAWCHVQSGKIADDCHINDQGVTYYMSHIPLISPKYTFLLAIVLQVIIIIIQAMKSGLSGNKKVTKKLIVEIVLCVIVITIYILCELTSVMTGDYQMYGNNICKFIFLGFVIVHNDQMWQGIKDLLSLIVSGYMGIV